MRIQIDNFLQTNTKEKYKTKSGILISDKEMKISNGIENIKLSRSEFRLLDILIKSNSKVFKRDELLGRVMDRSKEITDNALETLVSRLRHKLKPLGFEDLIVTIHSVGYKLNEKYNY